MFMLSQVSELWQLDLRIYTWRLLPTHLANSTIKGSVHSTTFAPPPRQQHITALVDGGLYVFGGRASMLSQGSDVLLASVGAALTTTVHGDFWRLTLPVEDMAVYTWPASNNTGYIVFYSYVDCKFSYSLLYGCYAGSAPIAISRPSLTLVPLSINSSSVASNGHITPSLVHINNTDTHALPKREGKCIKKMSVQVRHHAYSSVK